MKNKRTKEEYIEAVKSSFSIAQVCRKLNIKPVGGNYKSIHKAIDEYDIDTSHFTGQGWNVGLKFNPKPVKDINELLVANTYHKTYGLKRRLFKEHLKEKKCERCGFTMWQGREIPLELHHINGINTDNRLVNLQILCPNCHALIDNYRGLKLRKSAAKETLQVELP